MQAQQKRATMEQDDSQIKIKLLTKQQIYAVPEGPYSVPHKTTSTSLNTVLNQLLKQSKPEFLKQKEFDFLTAGELIRLPLCEHLDERGVSKDNVIDIEYIERIPAPRPQDSILHDDWVSGVEANQNWILTGCYDNTVNIWTTHGKLVASCKQHSNIVKKVSWLNPEDPSKGFVSVSHDNTGLLWEWEAGTDTMTPKIWLRGHTKSVDCIGVNPHTQMLATGGWDNNLKIWSASFEVDDQEPALKKIKGPHNITTRTPAHTLTGHKEAIQRINWIDNQTICTVSMDHTIKFWDAELCGIKNEIVGQKAYFGCSWSPLSNTLLTCSADKFIRLYDPRSSEGSVAKTTFKSHKMWVSSVKWSHYDEHLFISGGYDASVRLWDTRSSKASLYSLQGHEGQVLDVDWSNNRYIVSGGNDNNVHIFRNKHLE